MCLEGLRNVRLGCGHAVLCTACVPKLRACPICRADIASHETLLGDGLVPGSTALLHGAGYALSYKASRPRGASCPLSAAVAAYYSALPCIALRTRGRARGCCGIRPCVGGVHSRSGGGGVRTRV